MLSHRLRKLASFVRSTPLHPQWLLRFGCSGIKLEAFAEGRVLDIGCADRWLENSIPAGCEYVGLDFPLTGKGLYGSQPDIFADAASLPFLDESFDTVMLLEVLEHVKEPQAAISEASRVLKADGKIILTMPFLYPMHDEPNDYQRYTKHGLEREASNVGLKIEMLMPSLGSAETAGLIMNLALGGMSLRAMEKRHIAIAFIPFIVFAIPVVNLVCFLISRALPPWSALTAGYTLTASKARSFFELD